MSVKGLIGAIQFSDGGEDLSTINMANIHVSYIPGGEVATLSSTDIVASNLLTVSGDLIVGGNVTIDGNLTVISTNNLVIDDPIIELARNAPDGTTAGVVFQRPSGNVMIGYLSTEESSLYDNTLVLGYTTGGAHGTKLPLDTSQDLSVYISGNVITKEILFDDVNGSYITGGAQTVSFLGDTLYTSDLTIWTKTYDKVPPFGGTQKTYPGIHITNTVGSPIDGISKSRVGIFSVSPTHTLTVNGDISGVGTDITELNADNISTGTINNDLLPSTISVNAIEPLGGGDIKIGESSGSYLFYDSSTDRFGVNNETPLQTFDVNGNVVVRVTGYAGLQIISHSASFVDLEYVDTSGVGEQDNTNKPVMRFRESFIDVFGSGSGIVNFILEDGRLGIGSTTPAYPLDVVGDSYISGQMRSSSTTNLNIRAVHLGQNSSYYIYSDGSSTIDYSVPSARVHNFLVGSSNPISIGQDSVTVNKTLIMADGKSIDWYDSSGNLRVRDFGSSVEFINTNKIIQLQGNQYIFNTEAYPLSKVGIGSTSSYSKTFEVYGGFKFHNEYGTFIDAGIAGSYGTQNGICIGGNLDTSSTDVQIETFGTTFRTPSTGLQNKFHIITGYFLSGVVLEATFGAGLYGNGEILLCPFGTKGKVGIGKTDPNYKLEISGDFAITGNVLATQRNHAFAVDNSNVFISADTLRITRKFYDTNEIVMDIEDGNIGIGTRVPNREFKVMVGLPDSYQGINVCSDQSADVGIQLIRGNGDGFTVSGGFNGGLHSG